MIGTSVEDPDSDGDKESRDAVKDIKDVKEKKEKLRWKIRLSAIDRT